MNIINIERRSVGDCLRVASATAGAGGLCLLLSAPVAAADTGGTDASDRLMEIVVTAQKRTENLENVPISAQVVSGQTLKELNYNSLSELTQAVPGVHVSSGDFSNSLTIRGVGSGPNNPSYDQSVATFVDDIYLGRSRVSEATFFDLDRIEVLKGPQSTFFGNNAIAGALNIVTKQPGDTLDASGRLLYGQYGQYAAEAAIGGPLSDVFGARLAVTRNGESGWIDNVNTGRKAPVENNEAARLTLSYKPSGDLDVTLKIEGSSNKTSGTPGDQPLQWVNCPPPAPIATPYGTPNCAQALANGVPVGLGNNNNSGLPGQGSSLSTAAAVLTANYRQWGQAFTSVTGVNTYHFGATYDSLLPIEVLNANPTEKYHQLSQELRIASSTGQTIEYLAGVYFQTDKLDESIDINAPFANFIATIPGFGGLAPYLPLSFNPAFSQDENIYSIFGSVRWNVTDDLRFNAGLRGSRVTKDFVGTLHYGTSSQLYGGFTPIPAALEPLWAVTGEGLPGTQNVSQRYHALMPSAGVQYQLSPAAMLYFTYNKGFKAGGFNGLEPTSAPANLEFGPEHVNAFEVGLKSKWFEDTLLVNVDAFRDNYQGLQANSQVYLPATQTYTPLVKNAADSRAEGIELETQWVVTRDFRIGANVTYLHSYYVSFPNANPAILQNVCSGNYVLPYCGVYPNPVPKFADLSGQPTAYAPKWSGSVVASYGVSLPGELRLTANLSPYVTSSYTSSPGDAFYQVAGHVRLDGRLTLEQVGGHWAVDVIAKNLADRLIVNNPVGTTASPYFQSKEEPRNVAVQVRYRY